MVNKKIKDKQALLRDKRVLAEIDRHLWIESEKAGYDIGFEEAKEDWLKNFSSAWMSYHAPDLVGKKPSSDKSPAKAKNGSGKTGRKKRSAKSYLK
ncbi:MAG: hypothetical protein ACLFPX_04820 [Candidatus Omnitrophota bacterium]